MKHIKEFRLVESKEPEISREYYPDGKVEREKWLLNNKYHREDGPAWILYYPDSNVKEEVWSLKGKWHREDGPASIEYYPDGKVKLEEWWINNKQLSKAQWVEKTPGLSAEELVEISNSDPSPEVRRAARRNRRFPEDLEGWSINLDDWT